MIRSQLICDCTLVNRCYNGIKVDAWGVRSTCLQYNLHPQRINSPENLIVNYGEMNRQSDYPTVKQESHPPPKKPLSMNPLASPVTEWGAPGADTRSNICVIIHRVPRLRYSGSPRTAVPL